MKRLPNLDPLRFILASFVLMYHLPLLCKGQDLPYFNDLPILNRGSQAVRMFFVLSGFLIIRLIYKEKLKGTFSIKKFYTRRILRIFPLYFLVLTFGFVFYNIILPFLNIPFEISYNIIEGILLTVFFLPNVFAFEYQPGGILEVLWSIGIEEQFYLIIAPLLYILKFRRILVYLLILTIMYFVIFHFSNFSFLRDYKFVYFYLFSGGIIAILEEKKSLEFLKSSVLIPICIVVLTVLSFITDVFQFEELWIKNAILSVLFSVFIHSLAFNNRGVVINNKILNYLGTISYGIYMLHFIAINFVVFSFMKLTSLNIFSDSITIILINISTFVITIILSHFSYKYFESYFLKLKQKFRG